GFASRENGEGLLQMPLRGRPILSPARHFRQKQVTTRGIDELPMLQGDLNQPLSVHLGARKILPCERALRERVKHRAEDLECDASSFERRTQLLQSLPGAVVIAYAQPCFRDPQKKRRGWSEPGDPLVCRPLLAQGTRLREIEGFHLDPDPAHGKPQKRKGA